MNQLKLTHIALFTALVAVATMVISIPLPAVQGFINVGDSVILLVGLLFGPLVAGVAGGFGSALADLLLGYAHWAPWTLVIKGLEGVIIGYLASKPMIGLPLAAIWMVFGYFIAASFFYGIAPALTTIPGDLLQGFASVLIAWILYPQLRKRLKVK